MQKDLFKDMREDAVEMIEPVAVTQTQPSFFERVHIVLTLDKIILWGLLNITAMVFIYSAGIEHGMKASHHGLAAPDAEVLKAEPVENSSSVLKPDIPPAPTETAVPAPAAVSPADPSAPKAKEEPSLELKNGHFTIQLVTYNRKDQAQGEVTRLNQKGHQAFIISSGKFHQVCVEKFEKKMDASKKLVELKSESLGHIYQGAYVRAIKNG